MDTAAVVAENFGMDEFVVPRSLAAESPPLSVAGVIIAVCRCLQPAATH
jgi:hypothetical protein